MLTARFALMMFLQFFCWGAWFATLGQALATNGLAAVTADAFGSAPLAAMIAPLLVGTVADRFAPTQVVLGILFVIGGGLMWQVGALAEAGNVGSLSWMMLAYMLTFMPTLALTTGISMSHLDSLAFPKVRVWGTIGWIAAGLTVGGLGWSASLSIFSLAAVASAVLGIYCFTLPHTPAPAKGEVVKWRSLLMLDAFALLKRRDFAVFLLCSCAICVPLAYYFGLSAQFLGAVGFAQPAATMTLGQLSEIVFMLAIPFLFRRLGVKGMLLIGMSCWVLRYGLYALGAPDQVLWMILLAIALHGICYDFFFVTGFIYAEEISEPAIRNQTQSLLVFATQGVGMFIGYRLAFSQQSYGYASVTNAADLDAAIAQARPASDAGFWQQGGSMFDFGLPAEVDAELLGATMEQMRAFWLWPAGFALVVTVIFAIAFPSCPESVSENA